ncbi:MAG: HDIG domain-containing protein [Clostridiales bacterium]|uniref:HDIG domain-containing metalloprotein n=1 Tax=Clostridium sp. N3C TaxID=1776758 RepID=UPI00092E1240|nr:HDIG domain-containing metalloprotein [Clostridium sp. N3C]NLZ47427.1 HDIG domain-containing protein [Clostridiales bacterium]SCN26495.1 multifunctional tRNA nucleotidyl transferase/2'3'-cyclic phosphodiesterase/2'nucleotidase/phosphatase [Clostridium sp. N3C]
MGKDYFEEISIHLLEDQKPSEYLYAISKESDFKEYPFYMLYALKDTPQNLVHHPEGSVWNHTMMVVDEGAKRRDKSRNPKVFMWAALLHDIGKAPTTKLRKGRITSYDHDKVGKELAEKFLKEFTSDEFFIREVSAIVRWHMQPLFIVKNLPFSDIRGMLSEVDLDEISLFSLCDRLGRGNMSREKAEEERKNIELFTNKCREYLASKN